MLARIWLPRRGCGRNRARRGCVGLTSRADSVRTRLPRVPATHADAASDDLHTGSVIDMKCILVVNAGSSSVKFQVFALEGPEGLEPFIRGEMDGDRSRPRLRAGQARHGIGRSSILGKCT